jgi:hypothetical protein
LKQDRCMTCAKHTIYSEIIWTRPMELIRDMGHVKSHFGPFRDSVCVSAT